MGSQRVRQNCAISHYIFKVTVIKTVYYKAIVLQIKINFKKEKKKPNMILTQKGHTDQWNRTGRPEMNPYLHEQLI